MAKNNNRSGPPGAKRLGLLLLTPLMAAMLVPPADAATKIAAKSKFDKKTGNLVVSGRVKGLAAGSPVTVYDAATNQVLYSKTIDSKGKFQWTVPANSDSLCKVNVVAGDAQQAFSIGGADKTCKKAPTCRIAEGDKQIQAGAGVSLSVDASKTSKKDPLSFSWMVSNTGPTVTASATQTPTATGNSLSHTFDYTGLYRVDLKGSNSAGTCSDSVTVSVAPTSSPSSEALAASAKSSAPAAASALNTADGGYVVLPFEETGMQGGSQVNLPYNPLIPYNSLNAQVIQKIEHKPVIVGDGTASAYYSAGINPTDPVGSDSINSTSQNWFGEGKVGSNVDYAASKHDTDPSSKTYQYPTQNEFIAGQDFVDATVRKTEQWDRMYQKNRTTQTGFDMAWQQNRFSPAKPLAQPDEGIRGFVDMGEGVRAMPGIADPYNANDPQAIPYNSAQNAFVAQFIPASNVDDKGRVNPYPVMRVEAKVDGATVAKADTVYTTASETRCRECHLPGGIAADDQVWRTPVTEAELTLTDGSPGPATGKGSFFKNDSDVRVAAKAHPPAIHNRFTNKHPENSSFNNLINSGADIPRHTDTDIRTDRVKEVRWVKLDDNGNATNEISTTKPADTQGWTEQVRLKFRSGADYGNAEDPVAQEKAALFNTLVMHDYMVKWGPNPDLNKVWPKSYSSQLADAYSEDDLGTSASQPMYFCSGHHQSQMKFDVGIGAKSPATNRSDYSRAFHAFHGKFQVYKADVTSGADGKAHLKGELVRDSRGHPLMYGGRGWDSQMDDDNGIPLVLQEDGSFPDNSGLKGTDPSTWDSTKFKVNASFDGNGVRTNEYYEPDKNNWRPDLFPMRSDAELMLPFGENVAMEDNCVTCHTGKTEKSYRDIHHAAGLKCDACHGDMLAVGNVFPNDSYDQNLMWAGAMGVDVDNGYDYSSLATAEANLLKSQPVDFRRPWLDEPDCGSCHIGDANLKEGDTLSSSHSDSGHVNHTLANVFSAGSLKQAWMDGDKSGWSMTPINARFAVMPLTEQRLEKTTTSYAEQPLSQALYRKSGDVHGSGANGNLTCSTCHGGSHAIWPNPNPDANDNVTAKQLQGYDGNIAECSVCHVKDDFDSGLVADNGKLVHGKQLGVAQGYRGSATVVPNVNDTAQNAFLAGPHGLHPVGDTVNEAWWKNADGIHVDDFKSKVGNGGWHSEMAYKPGPDGEDQCAACHGKDHKGTRLSKTLVAREFVSDKGKKIKVEAGQVIGCDLCHAMKVSFKRAPNPKAKDGGWPAAALHAPPMPDAISPSGSNGGGGGGH
ncbi:PKD domain-containing protein [Methylomonas sp. HYX-M1]|uniref:PKD domain-containing protein n=1 Tax=Methylomonas sp. HYX-M1 TaxID=3139307 RepID=UPI00345C200B